MVKNKFNICDKKLAAQNQQYKLIQNFDFVK